MAGPRKARCVTIRWLATAIVAGSLVCGVRAQDLLPPRPVETASPGNAGPAVRVFGLADLVRLGLEQHPSLRQAALDVEAAEGRALQAGLLPNPTLNFGGEEVGRQGGIHTLPLVSQEIPTAGKRRLSRAVAARDVDQVALAVLRQRFTLITTVRQGFFALMTAQRRLEVFTRLVEVAEATSKAQEGAFRGGQISEAEFLPFRIEAERLRGEAAAAQREWDAVWGRLTADMGVPGMAPVSLSGSLDAALPDYDFGRARERLLQIHPDVRTAQVGVTRAQLALRRAEAERVPNVTLAAGYSKNFNDRENQAQYQVVFPLPVFNRNQGNIRAAQAELGKALQEGNRVQADLVGRLWSAFGTYTAASQRIERYRASIPDREKAREYLARGGRGPVAPLSGLPLLQFQRLLADAELEYVRQLGEAWRAASDLAGLLLLEEDWPPSLGGPSVPPCPPAS